MERTFGLMAEFTKESGYRTRCMGMEISVGLITGGIKESIRWTRKKAWENSHGQMVGNT